MSTLTVLANQCDLCGHTWLPSGKPSIQCPKCRKRGWHKSGWQVNDLSSLELKIDPKMHMMGDYPDAKPDMAALRAICRPDEKIPSYAKYGIPGVIGKEEVDWAHRQLEEISSERDALSETSDADDRESDAEIPLCMKERWEDGQKAICGKDKGHQLDHGLWIKLESI